MGRLPGCSLVSALVLISILILAQPLPCHAATTDATLLDATTIAEMEARAQQAKPREQCFLYTQLVHSMTELAGHQMLVGDTDSATATLKRVQHYALLIHLGLANDTKRLMNAQLLMHTTTRRLGEFVQSTPFEDRDTMVATLKQLTKVEDELLTQVFSH
ncbi:hypothetical protein [Granulicella arctica]|uniref:Uncharacterized protein n=1 Tax=Granulicella arctica TaxID=940613 RepID=A0A7Y9PIS8_9BACT|nr:hypothetical protein [Granulicella arctica]NYF80678.1 hypothetical protein [Granulicella arctica]